MINEDYVSFETAKLLKEKGFEPLHDYRKCIPIMYTNNGEIKWGVWSDDWYPRITLQMAMKWLREVHNQIIVPSIRLDDRTSGTISCYIVGIWYIPKNNGGAFCYTSPTPYSGYHSYEEACEAGIKYCLENLI